MPAPSYCKHRQSSEAKRPIGDFSCSGYFLSAPPSTTGVPGFLPGTPQGAGSLIAMSPALQCPCLVGFRVWGEGARSGCRPLNPSKSLTVLVSATLSTRLTHSHHFHFACACISLPVCCWWQWYCLIERKARLAVAGSADGGNGIAAYIVPTEHPHMCLQPALSPCLLLQL
jgi:hypothetical protein